MSLYHTAKGPVNYTIVGNPTIVDGVASGFSDSDFVRISAKPLSCPNEGKIAFHYTRQSAMNQILICCILGQYFPFRIRWLDRTIQLSWMSDSTTQAAARGGTYSITEGDYYITFNFSNNVWIVKLYNSANELLEALTSDQTSVYWPSNAPTLRIGSYSATSYWQGSIDLNNTYIKVNGQPWFGVCPVEVQKHQLRGPVGYTVVGSPTIVDNVASGFSSSNYLETAIGLSEPFYSVESFCKFTTGQTIGQSAIYGTSVNWTRYGFYIDSNAHLCAGVMIEGTSRRTVIGTTVLQPSTTYYAKMSADIASHTITLSVSTDNQTWDTDILNFEGGTGFYTAYTKIRIGYTQHGAFAGSIDLNETYIKVNGKLWFYQPAPTKYIIKDNSLVFADQGLYLTGPVNYTKTGTPTIVDNMVSGFSSSDYLKLNRLPANQASLEMYVKFKTSNIDTRQFIVAYGNYWGVEIKNTGKISCSIYFVPSSEALVNLDTILAVNTVYTTKTEIKNGTMIFSLYSANGVLIETKSTTYSGTFGNQVVWLGKSSPAYPNTYFNGSIDLNQTYIKVNDQLWFYGKNYATKNIAPVPAGYTYGTTTTPSIGYVDMRTQAFTEAPSGATIGRDE